MSKKLMLLQMGFCLATWTLLALLGASNAQSQETVPARDPAFESAARLIHEEVTKVIRGTGVTSVQLRLLIRQPEAGESTAVDGNANAEARSAALVLLAVEQYSQAAAANFGWSGFEYDPKSPDIVRSGNSGAVLRLLGKYLPGEKKMQILWDLQLPNAKQSPAASGKVNAGYSLSTAAYSGAFSFEARRWIADPKYPGQYVLSNVDLPQDREIFGGVDWEIRDFDFLKTEAPHPLDRNDFPFVVQVVVGKETRQPELIGGQVYVALEPNETFAIRLGNKSPKYAITALYVDGVNSINPSKRPPHLTTPKENWFLGSGYSGIIEGWSTPRYGAPVGSDSERRFAITDDTKQTVAGSLAGDGKPVEQMGTITAVFYAFEPTKTPLPPKGKGGTASGEQISKAYAYDQSGRQKDVILAAVSIHYRSKTELQKLRESNASHKFVAGGAVEIFEKQPLPHELQISESIAVARLDAGSGTSSATNSDSSASESTAVEQ